MVFLRPVVMRDAETANKLSLDRYELIRAFQKEMQPTPNVLVPINEAPVLPPMRRSTSRPADLGAADARRQRPPRRAAAATRRRRRSVPAVAPATVRRRAGRRRTGVGAGQLSAWALRHPLPYAYAKAHTLLLEDDGARLVLWAPETVGLPALSEVLRLYDVDALRARAGDDARRPHRRGLCRRRVERGGRDRRGRERGRPVAHDAGAAGDRGPARGERTTRRSSAC